MTQYTVITEPGLNKFDLWLHGSEKVTLSLFYKETIEVDRLDVIQGIDLYDVSVWVTHEFNSFGYPLSEPTYRERFLSYDTVLDMLDPDYIALESDVVRRGAITNEFI